LLLTCFIRKGCVSLQISLNAEHFKNCLEIVEKALPARSTMPVISNILLDINNDCLNFSATNLEMFIKSRMDYEGSESGKILLPPKIVDIMRYFPTDKVTLDINWDNYRINVSGGSANFHLYGSNPEDYPITFDITSSQKKPINIDQKKLKSIIKSVVFAASNEETRPAFNGVLLSSHENTFSLTASDTYRLAIKELKDDNWSLDDNHSLVPARSMRELLRILGEHNANILILREKNILAFQLQGVYFATRLLEEKYPDVSGVIPNDYKTRIILERKDFEETINRASLLAEGKNHAVNIIVNNNQLEVKVSGQEGSMEEILPVVQDGEDIELFANTRFVSDVLKIIEEQKIIVDFHGDGGPLIFRIEEDPGYLYLVLPIKKVN